MSSGKCHYWSLPDGIHSNSVGTKAVSRKTWAKRQSAWQPSPALPWHQGSHLRLSMGASGEGGLYPPLPGRLPQQGAEHSLQVLEAQASRSQSLHPEGLRGPQGLQALGIRFPINRHLWQGQLIPDWPPELRPGSGRDPAWVSRTILAPQACQESPLIQQLLSTSWMQGQQEGTSDKVQAGYVYSAEVGPGHSSWTSESLSQVKPPTKVKWIPNMANSLAVQ